MLADFFYYESISIFVPLKLFTFNVYYDDYR